MSWKIIGYIFLGLLGLVLLGGIGYTFVKTTESQKAGVINNFTFEPHFGFLGGCARYQAPEKMLQDARGQAKKLNVNKALTNTTAVKP